MTANKPPDTTLPTVPISPSAQICPGLAPRARSACLSSAPRRNLAPDELSGDQEARESDDAPEDADREGVGFDGALCLGQHHRGDSLEGRYALWVQPRDLGCDRRVEARAAYLHPALAVIDAALEQGPRKRRREQVVGGRPIVGLVLHDGSIEGHDPNERGFHDAVRLYPRRAEIS